MNYLLVKSEELDGQGYDYQYAERIPDGRVILQLNALKVLSNFTPDIFSGDKLKALIKEQKASGLYAPPEEGSAENSEELGTDGSDNDSESPSEDIAMEESTSTEAPIIEEGGEE